jgi:hypothetical protein
VSETPITDAHCARCECSQTPCKCATQLRELETALTAACERNGNLSVELAAMTAERDSLLAAHAKCKRELAIRRGIERELFALTEGMMDAQCPPWARGDEPEECPGDNCSKCWRKYFDGKLKPKKEKR